MKISELYAQVAALGFEDALESDKIFLGAASRALFEVNRIRPREASILINHAPPENLIEDSFEPITVKGELLFEAYAPKALYFEAQGAGTCRISEITEVSKTVDGKEIIEEVRTSLDNPIVISSPSSFGEYRVRIKKNGGNPPGRVEVQFSGEYAFSVRNVALYDVLYGPDDKDIPRRAQYTDYDMRELAEDFLEFKSPPIAEGEEYRKLSGDYDLEGGHKLLLPYDKPGCYKVLYKRRPRGISGGDLPKNSSEVIDLDEDLSALLAPLIAAYVFAEDEPSLSEYYMTLYRQGAAEIRTAARQSSVVRMINANNW